MEILARILRRSKRAPKLLMFSMLYIFAILCYMATSVPPRAGQPDTRGQIKQRGPDSVIQQTTYLNNITYSDKTICDMELYINKNHQTCKAILNRNPGSKPLGFGDEGKSYNDVRRIDIACDIKSTADCCDVARYSYLYDKHKITDEEKKFPLAFAMKIHNSGNQAHRLLRYIYRPHNVYCIHVDKKASKLLYEQFLAISKCFNNIFVIEDRVRVIYSSIRQVQAEIKCMKSTFMSGVDWKYYINLAGHEFMLKTNLQIVKILKLLNGSNDIESYPIGVDVDRVLTRSFLTRNLAIRTKERKEPIYRKVTLRKGSAYGMFSRAFVIFVLNDKLVQELVEWLSDTYAPEETIWATLNALPGVPGGYTGEITHSDGTFLSRAVKWKGSDDEICYGRYVRRVCVFGKGDVPWLLAHKNIVANKFYEHFESEALDCIESVMYGELSEDTRRELSVVYEDVYKSRVQRRHTS